jgi:Flp pilus assembly protein TadD
MRHSIRESMLPVALRALAVGTSLALALGCTSLQGARLYASGTEALDRGDGAQAVADLERAAELLPDASPVQNHLGLAYVQVGRDAEARAAFQRAVDLDCSNQAAQHNLRAAKAGHLRPPEASHVP